jgi:hypothetical protein
MRLQIFLNLPLLVAGGEGMILSQRYPTVFNGIVSGDPAIVIAAKTSAETDLHRSRIVRLRPIIFRQFDA